MPLFASSPQPFTYTDSHLYDLCEWLLGLQADIEAQRIKRDEAIANASRRGRTRQLQSGF